MQRLRARLLRDGRPIRGPQRQDIPGHRLSVVDRTEPPHGLAAWPAAVCILVMALAMRVQFDTPLGSVLVIRQNDGGLQPAAGEAVNLVWRAEDMRAVPGDALTQP